MADVNVGTVGYKVTLNAQSMLVASQKALADFKKFSSEISTAGKKMEADIEASSKRTKAHFEAQAAAASAAAKSIGRDMMLAGGAMVGALALGVKAGAELEKKLNDVRNNTTMTAADFQLMQTAIKELGSKSSAPLDQLADGFMHITNFGFKAAESQKILEEAMKSALSTGGNVSTTANILAAVMHEFSIETNKAGAAMNVLHIASALGNQTLEQFNQAAGPMLAYAAGIGIKLEDAAAAMSALTRHGFDAAEAATQVRNQIAHIINPSEKAKEALERLSKQSGINLVKDFSVAGLQARGLYGVIGDLRAVSEKTGVAMGEITKDLIPAMRGGIGTLVLAGRGFEDFTEIIKQTAGAMGGTLDRTTKDYERTTKTTAFTVGMLKNNMELLALDIQKTLGPVVNDLVATMGKLLRAFEGQSEAAKTSEVRMAAWFGAITLGVGAVVTITTKIAEMAVALKAVGASAIAARAGILGVVTLGATALAEGGIFLGNKMTDQINDSIGKRKDQTRAIYQEYLDAYFKTHARKDTLYSPLFGRPIARFKNIKSALEGAGSGGGGDQKEDEDADKRKKRIQEIRADIIEAEFGENARAQYEAALKKFEDAKLVGRAMAEQEYNAKMEEIIDKMIQQRHKFSTEEFQKSTKLSEEARQKNFQQWDQLLGRETGAALSSGSMADTLREGAAFMKQLNDLFRPMERVGNFKEIMQQSGSFFARFNEQFHALDATQPFMEMTKDVHVWSGLAQSEKIIEAHRRTAEEVQRIWNQVADSVQNAFASAFDMGLNKGSKQFFRSLGDEFSGLLKRMLAEAAAAQAKMALFGGGGGGGGLFGGLFKAIGLGSLFGGGGALDFVSAAATSDVPLAIGFDDPVNDAMAFRWGKDFGHHFSGGALESARRMAVAGNGAPAGGMVVINLGGTYHIREEADISKLADGLAVEIQRRSRVRF